MISPDAARKAAIRGLMFHGLTEGMSERIASQMVTFQPDEWARILNRVERGEVKHLYVIVTHFDRHAFGTFLYAPADDNNIATLTTWLGTGMGSGCLVDDTRPVDEVEADQKPGAYEVSLFDIAKEVNRAVLGVR
jgi:hypothetical protein